MAVGTYALTTLANANTEMGLTSDSGAQDAKVEKAIDKATAIIESALNRKIMARLYTKERYDGKRQNELYFNQYPVLSTNLDNIVWDAAGKTATRADGGSFVLDGWVAGDKVLVQDSALNGGLLTIATGGVAALVLTFDDTIVDDTDDDNIILSRFRTLFVGDVEIPYDNYEVNDDYIYYLSGFAKGNKNIRITYYAGYITVPADIEQKCLEITRQIYVGKTSIKKEALGAHSIEFFDDKQDMEEEIRESLSNYINWQI